MMKTFLLSASATLLMAGTAIAQTSHGIAAVVNDDIVTTHDLRQRTLFMVATSNVLLTAYMVLAFVFLMRKLMKH